MIAKPKGTYDILPNESSSWAKLEETIRKICKLYNYKEIRTPIFESFNVFHRDLNDTLKIDELKEMIVSKNYVGVVHKKYGNVQRIVVVVEEIEIQ